MRGMVGDLHLIKDPGRAAPRSNRARRQGLPRTTWCGLSQAVTLGCHKDEFKATYNKAHVTCQDCLREYGLHGSER